MIQTSSLYKSLLEQGAIQEYKIVVDGVEYLDDAIYDNVILKQQLFSTDTFSVGGFALSTLEVKLRVSTLDIPRNANIKFYYRLTNLEENSEWIKKFTGRVTKRKRYTNDVTTIEVVSDASNFDIFLNIFNDQITSYPANNRQVSNLCATHLGLDVENINDVYDGNNVEYPNEMTVVEVLQNIAALSGGNWIITEDDKLRLVVLNKQIEQIPKYSAFNISSEESLPPISRVTMYYQDDKAFTAGDDTGSELTIDCSWATQETTNYVLSLYNGYVYQPIQGSGVAIDGAIQLGDHFEYDNGQIQLASKIDYSFTKALTANVDAPLSTEDNYDDPWNQITQAPLRRKVTLGDSYQGVTIDRQNGIMMLMSPDGTEENALAKYYSDLNKGMAFQYRNSVDDPWEDWLYYDINEGRFKMMLKGGEDLEGKLVIIEADLDTIRQTVENIHLGNILPNANGKDGLKFWLGNGDTLYVSEDMRYVEGITYGTVALPVTVPGSASEFGMSYYNKGEMISEFMRVIPTENTYSFRSKVSNFKPIKVKVLEYESNLENKNIYSNSQLEQGSISQTTGNNISSLNRVRSVVFNAVKSDVLHIYKNYTEFKYLFRFYDEDYNYITETTNFINSSYYVLNIPSNAAYYKIVISRTDDTILHPVAIPNDLLEFYTREKNEPTKETTYNLNSPMQYVTFTHTNQEATNFMKLTIEVATATINSMTTLTETMFNAREPKEWFEGASDVAMYSKSLFEQLSDKMVLMVNSDGKIVQAELGVNPDDGSYFVVNADNISLNGYTEINGKFRVNEDGTVFMQDAFVEGTINAVRGEIGNFEIENGVLNYTSPAYEREYTYADLSTIRTIIMKDLEPTKYEIYIYDTTGDNKVTSLDYMTINNYLKGEREKPKHPMIKSQVLLGTANGKITSRVLFGDDEIGVNTVIQADNVSTGTLETTGLSISGRSVEVDSNGFLKLV